MSAVSRIDPNGIYLNVAKDDMKNRGWDNPPLERRESFGEHVPNRPASNDEPRP
jgi:hypothetical protein